MGGFFFMKSATSGSPDISLSNITFADNKKATTTVEVPPLPLPEGYKEYRNEKFGFSLYYPQEFSPQEFEDRGPELTVVFQSAEGEPGFQIYVAPIDGAKITPERFTRDAPSGVIQEPRDIFIDGVQAVKFFGFDAKIGKTSERWFIKNHFLYEVSTYKELDAWLGEILNTWRFSTPTIVL